MDETPHALSADQLAAQIPRLRRYARALTGSRAAADDLTQDTLERAWAKRALWHAQADVEGGNLRGWLFAVMHNVFVNTVKRAHPHDSLDNVAAPEPMAESSSAETSVHLRDVQTALAQLPDEQREVVLLIGLEQLSYAEAARALAIPIGTVMSRLSRGRERLRQMLDETAARAKLRRVK